MTKILACLGMSVMAASISSAALALPAVQSAHTRTHYPLVRHIEVSRGRRHSPLVHGVRRDAHTGLATGKRIHKPI